MFSAQEDHKTTIDTSSQPTASEIDSAADSLRTMEIQTSIDDDVNDEDAFEDEPSVGANDSKSYSSRKNGVSDYDSLAATPSTDHGANGDTSRIPIDDAIELLGMGKFQYLIFIAAGLCFAADSMEVLLLSFLSIVLQAQWGWSDQEAASVTSAVFVGQSIGTLILGYFGDKIGRKPVLVVTAGIICFFGLVTAFCNTLFSLVFCRFMVGFGVGGLTVPFDTFAEFIPNSHRGSHLVTIEYWWCAGTFLVSLLAMFTLGQSGGDSNDNAWRWFVAWCSVPCFLSSIASFLYVPESPRWLVSQGRPGDALRILRDAASTNGKDPNELFPAGTELYQLEVEHAERFMDLFKPQWVRTTSLLALTWAGYTITAYSTIFMITLIFSDEDNGNNQHQDDGTYSFDYNAILASTPSEIVGTTLVLLTIDKVGRIPSQVATYFVGGCAVFGLCFFAKRNDNYTDNDDTSSSPRLLLISLGFLGRMCFFAGSSVTWITTAEILPTEIRNVGHSTANAVGRLSAALSPFLASNKRPYTTTGFIILIISWITALASSGLSETKSSVMGLASGTAGGLEHGSDRSGYDVV